MTPYQKQVADGIESQGYTRKQAERMARLLYPSRQDAALAAARAAKAARRAASKTTGAGSSNADTATKNSAAGPTSQKNHAGQTPEGRARIAAARHTANSLRWARVRALGLRNLKELAAYDAAHRVLTGEPA